MQRCTSIAFDYISIFPFSKKNVNRLKVLFSFYFNFMVAFSAAR